MKISLDVRKSLEENASAYFDAAKKARAKIEGARQAIERAKKAKQKSEAQPQKQASQQLPKKVRKKSWYEKFKWFMASNGMLVLAGRDAITNENLVKKHLEPRDVVFHTDAPGSPFVIVKTEGEEVSDEVLQEAADFCASHSKAWKLGLSSAETYWVEPEQVTKEAKAGEYMQKGSFMVYGKRNYVQPRVGLVAVPYEDKVMVAPEHAANARHTGAAARLEPGDTKASDTAKKVIAIIGRGEPDDVIPNLPAGGCRVEKVSLEPGVV